MSKKQVKFMLEEEEIKNLDKIVEKTRFSTRSKLILRCIDVCVEDPSLLERFSLPEEDHKLSPEMQVLFDQYVQEKRERMKLEQGRLKEIDKSIILLNRKLDWVMARMAHTPKLKNEVQEIKGGPSDLEVLGLE
ncbi:MAG: hypothetical protein ACXADY_04075 [Candidatus Hodarchaeales archaeon]|jgi:hypothetical protein